MRSGAPMALMGKKKWVVAAATEQANHSRRAIFISRFYPAVQSVTPDKMAAVTTVAEHYAQHLAPVYLWMAGGFEAAVARGATELDALGLSNGTIAVDLGAGFGMHAIPLARCGYSVLAVDLSEILLEHLREHAGASPRSLPIRAVQDDLLAFPSHLETEADLILCMGDTLTHLPDQESVRQLFKLAAAAL